MKKGFALFMAALLVISLVACTEKAPEPTVPETTAPTETTAPHLNPDLVCISMPNKDLQRWHEDGYNMKKQLEEAGYQVDLQYAENDSAIQQQQIEEMIQAHCTVLVIAAVDEYELSGVLDQAKAEGITVIAYDRLVQNTDAISYYVTFDNYDVGVKQGQYIVDKLDLANAGEKTYNIELIGGDADDKYAKVFYDGAMEVLRPYLQAGTLKCQSGQLAFRSVATPRWSTDAAQSRFEKLLTSYYVDAPLDAVLASNDFIAEGVANALEEVYKNETYPIITGQDCEMFFLHSMMEGSMNVGKQAMSMVRDTRNMVTQTVEMIKCVLGGSQVPVNDTEHFDNGAITVPTCLVELTVVDESNFDELKHLFFSCIYYSQDVLA